MLNKECLVHISTVMDAAKNIWGYLDWKITDIEIIDAPFGAFNMTIRIRDRFDVMMEYEKSIWSILVKTNGEYTKLSQLTDQRIILFFERNKRSSLIHNFKILNQVLHSMENRT